MTFTELDVLSRYTKFSDSIRDARYWFENSRLKEFNNRCPKDVMKDKDGPRDLCQWIYLWGNSKLR